MVISEERKGDEITKEDTGRCKFGQYPVLGLVIHYKILLYNLHCIYTYEYININIYISIN